MFNVHMLSFTITTKHRTHTYVYRTTENIKMYRDVHTWKKWSKSGEKEEKKMNYEMQKSIAQLSNNDNNNNIYRTYSYCIYCSEIYENM